MQSYRWNGVTLLLSIAFDWWCVVSGDVHFWACFELPRSTHHGEEGIHEKWVSNPCRRLAHWPASPSLKHIPLRRRTSLRGFLDQGLVASPDAAYEIDIVAQRYSSDDVRWGELLLVGLQVRTKDMMYVALL